MRTPLVCAVDSLFELVIGELVIALGPEEVHQQRGVDLLLVLQNVILDVIVGAW